jgi:hypothetical protein
MHTKTTEMALTPGPLQHLPEKRRTGRQVDDIQPQRDEQSDGATPWL